MRRQPFSAWREVLVRAPMPRTLRGHLLRQTRKRLPLDGALPDGRSLPPDCVFLMPTWRCNLACPYCFQRDMAPPADELSIEEWLWIIDDIRTLGSTVVLLGGEILLYPPFLTLLSAVKAAGLKAVVITNGVLLPWFADRLVDMGLDCLIVSIDGPAEVHNRVRGHRRGYELAVEGIRRVLARRRPDGPPTVQVFCAISAYTAEHLASHAAAMGTLGVDRLIFNALISWPPAVQRDQASALRLLFGVASEVAPCDSMPSYGRVDPGVVARQLAAIRAGPWRRLVQVNPPGLARDPAFYLGDPDRPLPRRRCVAIYREMYVYPNGDVPACFHIPELVVGNVRRDGGVRSVWNGATWRAFRRHINGVGRLPICSRCVR